MAKAISVVNILEIYDVEKFQKYVIGHLPTIEKYNGKFLVKGAAGEILEGNWDSNRVVIHEFPSVQQFKAWYQSEDYQPWKELRQSCAKVNAILLESCS